MVDRGIWIRTFPRWRRCLPEGGCCVARSGNGCADSNAKGERLREELWGMEREGRTMGSESMTVAEGEGEKREEKKVRIEVQWGKRG